MTLGRRFSGGRPSSPITPVHLPSYQHGGAPVRLSRKKDGGTGRLVEGEWGKKCMMGHWLFKGR